MGQKAILMFDPDRRPEQVAFVTARTQILHQNGDQAWVVIDEGQAERMAAEGILVQFHPEADWIETPAIVFDPLVQEPQPPADSQPSRAAMRSSSLSPRRRRAGSARSRRWAAP